MDVAPNPESGTGPAPADGQNLLHCPAGTSCAKGPASAASSHSRLLSGLLLKAIQPFIAVDFSGLITAANRAFAGLVGGPLPDLLGRPLADFTPTCWLEGQARALAKVKATGRSLRFEAEVLHLDGRVVPISAACEPDHDAQGGVVGLYAFVTDLSARVQAETALRESERWSRALFEGIEDAVFVHDPEGRILDANPAACRLLGYSHEEFLRLTTSAIDDPSFAAGFHDRLAGQLAEGRLRCEGRHRAKDGRVFPVEINTSTLQFDDRRAVLAVIRDLSARLALEDAQQELADSQQRNAQEMAAKNAELTTSEARYRRLTEGCLDGVVVADRLGRLTLLNPSAARVFGYEPAEVLGRPIGDLLPDLAPSAGRTFEETVRGRDPVIVGQTVEIQGRRQGGELFPLELSLSVVDGDGDGDAQFIGSIRDQAERHRMHARLAQSERLASIGLMSAGVAHEINNPLAYVANNLAVLERDLAGVADLINVYESAHPALESAAPETLAKARELAETLDWEYVRANMPRMFSRTREGVQRVATIVSNLRWLARTSPSKLESVRISDLVESALEMVRLRLRRRHIEIEIEHGVENLICIPTQISQVLLNLLINACQAVESSGKADGGRIRFSSREENGMAVLAIADNGPGIPPESLARLFDPFYTTKEVGEGTGLGLSICHGIVTGHGGRIEVESRLGEGAAFRLVLPIAPS